MTTRCLSGWLKRRYQTTGAFTHLDLLAVTTVLLGLSVLTFVSLADGRIQSSAVVCLNNLRRLTLAWQLYAADHREELPGAAQWAFGSQQIPEWSGGSWLTLNNPRDENNWDHEKYTKNSVLWPYVRTVEAWVCPADPSRGVLPSGEDVPRVRSYSLNNWVGGPGWANSGLWWPMSPSSTQKGWQVYRKSTDFVRVRPSQVLAFMDEREDSINDAFFTIDMAGYPGTPALFQIVDFPGAWHNEGANVAFADGHVEHKRWLDARTVPPRKNRDRPLDVPSANNQDVRWLQEHSSRNW